MAYSRPHHRRGRSRIEPDVQRALAAMSAEELRSCVQEVLEQLDDRARTALVDALIARSGERELWLEAVLARQREDEGISGQ